MQGHEPRATLDLCAHAPRRRSRQLTLVFIGAASAGLLSACGCDPTYDRVSRDLYEQRADCEADFNKEKCESVSEFESPVRGQALTLGPRYAAPERTRLGVTRDPRPGSRAFAVFTDDVRRGGFGFSAACRQSSSYSG